MTYSTSPTLDAPQHEHDCDECVFLGRHGEYDLYFHEGSSPILTTLVARHGADGAYRSGLVFSLPCKQDGETLQPVPELAESRARAVAAGFGPAIDKAERWSA